MHADLPGIEAKDVSISVVGNQLTIEGRQVHLHCWRYDVTGVSGFTVPVYFLDADLPENVE
jgi:HSP20 family molecular chaperone IbpA